MDRDARRGDETGPERVWRQDGVRRGVMVRQPKDQMVEAEHADVDTCWRGGGGATRNSTGIAGVELDGRVEKPTAATREALDPGT